MVFADLLQTLAGATTLSGLTDAAHLALMVYLLKVAAGIARHTSDLHTWHDQDHPDSPGRKIWWSDADAAKSLKLIAENGVTSNKLLASLNTEQKIHTEKLTSLQHAGRVGGVVAP